MTNICNATNLIYFENNKDINYEDILFNFIWFLNITGSFYLLFFKIING